MGGGAGGVDYPLRSDETKTVSRAYGALDETEGVRLRATPPVLEF